MQNSYAGSKLGDLSEMCATAKSIRVIQVLRVVLEKLTPLMRLYAHLSNSSLAHTKPCRIYVRSAWVPGTILDASPRGGVHAQSTRSILTLFDNSTSNRPANNAR